MLHSPPTLLSIAIFAFTAATSVMAESAKIVLVAGQVKEVDNL